jgi:divalent metal cation (Fe/Co/Zn/Cd) transporter
LTLAGAALAAITCLALFVTSAFGWWWADPVAAPVIAIGLAAEGLRVAIRHRFG